MRQPSAPRPITRIDYEELELEVAHSVSGKSEVRVLHSAFGRPRERFQPAYNVADLQRRLGELDGLMLEPPGKLEPSGRTVGSSRSHLAQSIGTDLYGALFPASVRVTLEQSLARLHTKRDEGTVTAGLRIRLGFGDLGDTTAEVVGLPWELVCEPKARQFLGMASETPLVRYLDTGRHVRAVATKPPLRILAVMAEPKGLPPINLAAHRRILMAACTADGRIDLKLLAPASERSEAEIVGPPTVRGLRDALQQGRQQGTPFHAIHFLGHGGFDPDGRGFLNFEDEQRNRVRYSGQDLAALLRDFSELRLAVLATCVGARMVRYQGQHPFTGSASALVAGGLPAVVAMQFPVSELAAGNFTAAFYNHLAEGRSLEEAVTEGRMSILIEESQTIEWASPVLFLQARSGQVFHLQPTPQAPEARSESKRKRSAPKRKRAEEAKNQTANISGNDNTLAQIQGPGSATIKHS